ncbi:MAG TPA: Crp/Fnr family transcriptional regulator [Acidiferrobacterales bacterium]|nr:Crp/Fnr family transcriptional regulator [Acidiferrobacterales bacterium]
MQHSSPEQSSDFIARLAPADRDALLEVATRRAVTRGELIFKAGSAGDYVYFLESGRVKIYHLSPTGKEILLWFCFPGEIFGLAEVCHGGGRQVYAETCEPSQVLSVRQDDFKTFLATHPPGALLVNDVLACRLRNLGNIIQSLVASDVNERVAQLVMRLAATHGQKTQNGDITLDIRLTHQEMANMIGTTRQSVTSALNLLRRQGVLEFDANHHILVHSETLLTQAGMTAMPTTPPHS